jgi:SAM-dependent methyltransferase
MPADLSDGITPYDRYRYTSHAFAQTHPARLATVAALVGIASAPATGCRVLELGCGDGSNLIPLAFYLPDSTFVGIDLARTPIAAGCERIARLGLRNIGLRQGNLIDACDDLGSFDYVIAHGLYSWVPDTVRPHILRVAADRLADDEVAYISYNTLPGCRLRHLVRDLLAFRFGRDARDAASMASMRGFLDDFARIEHPASAEYFELVKREIAFAQNRSDDALYHDDLAPDSKAFYLHEFVADARTFGLQYLGEAAVADMFTMAGSEAFDRLLDGWSGGDWIAREQYQDFVRVRRFRQTLLCKASHRLRRDFGAEIVERFELRSALRLEDPCASPCDRSETAFRARTHGVKLVEPIAKCALVLLERVFPDSIGFAALLAECTSQCARAGVVYDNPDAKTALAAMLWALVRANCVELMRDPQRGRVDPDPTPCVNALVRDAITSGAQCVGPLHDPYELSDEVVAEMAFAMDATRDRAALLRYTCERTGNEPAAAAERLEELLAFLTRHGAFQALP